MYLPISHAEEEKWFDKVLATDREEQPLAIEIQLGEGWALIGNCGMFNLDWRNRSAELGIFIGDKAYWDKGYGTEVMRLLLRIGFMTLNLHRIYLRVYDNNLRAVHVYEKIGFVHEGRQRQAEFRDGRYLDLLLMSILRPEWNEAEE
jgi:RimJ/RimL family protein N-acetyltransferase